MYVPLDADALIGDADAPIAEETRNLEAAIAASLGEASQSNATRTCVICLTESAVMFMRPCNHLIACQGCARRLVRKPCAVCRRHVNAIERIFF